MNLTEHQDFIRRMAVKSGARPYNLEDIVQEINLRLVAADFRGESSEQTYIGTIAKRTTWEFLRKESRYQGGDSKEPLVCPKRPLKDWVLKEAFDHLEENLSSSDRAFLHAMRDPDYNMREHRESLKLKDTGYRAKRWRVFKAIKNLLPDTI